MAARCGETADVPQRRQSVHRNDRGQMLGRDERCVSERSVSGGQKDGERAALADGALDLYAAAVGPGNMLDDGQSQARSTELPAPGLVHSIESFEQAGQVATFNAAAFILKIQAKESRRIQQRPPG